MRLVDVTLKVGSGATPRGGANVYVPDGVAFIRSQNIYDNFFEFAGLAHLTNDAAQELAGVTVEPKDVLMCITGESVTRTALVVPEALPARVSQHVAILRANPTIIRPEYLKAILLEPVTKQKLNLLSEAGATRRALTKKHLENFEIQVPPLDVQDEIVNALGSFEDLIALERRNTSNVLGLISALCQEFRESLRGVDRVMLTEVAEITKGYSYKSQELTGDGSWLVNLKNIGRAGEFRPNGFKQLTASPNVAQKVAHGDLLVALTDLTQAMDLIGKPVRVQRGLLHGDLVISLDLCVIRPKGTATREFLYAILDGPDFRNHCLSFSNGTTVIHMSSKAFAEFELPLPDEQFIRDFSEKIRTLWDEHDKSLSHVELLQSAHAELLPLLVTDRLKLKNSGSQTR